MPTQTVTDPIILDSTGQDIVEALNDLKNAVQPTNVCVDISTSLPASGWSSSAPYVQNWMNNKVTDECSIRVEFLSEAVNTGVLYIEPEKIAGGVKFTAPVKPTTAIPVVVHILNAEAESITSISGDMVSTNVVSGASNVNEAFTRVVNLARHTRLTDFSLTDLQNAVVDQNLAKYGLKVGDYKTINGHDYVIAGLNVMKGTHDYTCKYKHVGLIVIPHTTCKWNASGHTYEGADNRGAGYLNSDLHYYLKNTVKGMCDTDLGSGHLYAHQKLMGNAINQTGYNRFGTNSGCTSGWTWSSEYISALTEAQVFGGDHWSSSGYDTGEANTLLPVFAEYKHTDIFGSEYVWLRNVSSASQACFANDNGNAHGVSGAEPARYVAGLILYH